MNGPLTESNLIDSSSMGSMNLSSHVCIHRFVNSPRRVWIEHAGKSVVCDEKIVLLFLSRRTGRAGRKGTSYTFVTSEQGR